MIRFEKIEEKDVLNTGRKKLNNAIAGSEQAVNDSTDAKQKSEQALSNSESTQSQLDTIVIEGDSSVEAAQARVTKDGKTYDTLKDRLDGEQEEVSSQLADIAINVKTFGAVGDGETDDTESIQNALDYVGSVGGGTVLIPKGTYMIDGTGEGEFWQGKGILIRSNTSVLLDKDTVLKTIPNNKTNSKLVNIRNVENVSIKGGTLVGDREEHIGTEGEWGRNIAVSGSKNVKIEDLVTKDSWGDGITIGKAETLNHSKNITIKNVISVNNRRQGMSVITVDGLYVYDSEFNDTNGALPESGIDFEPDDDDIKMDNIYMNNVKFKNNKGEGIDFAFNNISTSKKINITIDNPVFEGSGIAFSSGGNVGLPDYEGSITINNPIFKKLKVCKNVLWNWHNNMPTIYYNNPVFIIDEEFNYTHSDYSCLFKVITREETDYIKNTGNLVVRNLICKKTDKATILPQRIMYNSPLNEEAVPVENVKIIDPLDVSGLQNPTVYFGSNVGKGNMFTDSNELCVYRVDSINTNLRTDLAPFVTDGQNDVVNRNVYLSRIPIGQTVTFRKVFESQGNINIRIPGGSTLINGISTVVRYGESTTIKRLSEEEFSVVNTVNNRVFDGKGTSYGTVTVPYVDAYWLRTTISGDFAMLVATFNETSTTSSEAKGLTLSVAQGSNGWIVKIRSIDGSFEVGDSINVNYIAVHK